MKSLIYQQVCDDCSKVCFSVWDTEALKAKLILNNLGLHENMQVLMNKIAISVVENRSALDIITTFNELLDTQDRTTVDDIKNSILLILVVQVQHL